MTTLLAYDGKPHSETILDYAIGHAIAYGKTLFIISSVASKDPGDHENELSRIKEYLEAAKCRASGKGVEVRTLIGAGSPAEEILAAAERIGADTIIVGHTGKTAIDRVLWGTVSEYVLRNTKCTVIIVQ